MSSFRRVQILNPTKKGIGPFEVESVSIRLGDDEVLHFVARSKLTGLFRNCDLCADCASTENLWIVDDGADGSGDLCGLSETRHRLSNHLVGEFARRTCRDLVKDREARLDGFFSCHVHDWSRGGELDFDAVTACFRFVFLGLLHHEIVVRRRDDRSISVDVVDVCVERVEDRCCHFVHFCFVVCCFCLLFVFMTLL